MANVEVQVHDALTPDETLVGKCDLVVADLPCSGLGTLGRKPEIRYRMTPQMIGELSQLQRKMLAVAQAYVKPGGRLVFSTCTVSPTENRENAAWFLETYTGFSPGLIHGVGFDIPGAIMGDGTIQLLPGVCPCDGFFIGVFRRDG
jgi:16S rRNA (cytosine967-C5)-methyltransferase